MPTRICVLRSGGEYRPRHVQWLADQVPGLVCLSDVPVPGIETIPLVSEWPGWWSKIELFRPDIDGDLLYLDLDTVVLGDLEPFELAGATTMVSDFYRLDLPNSSLMYIAEADKSAVWESFNAGPTGHMMRCRTRSCWGDQGFLQGVLPDAQRWQEVLPGKVVSFKADCRGGLPPGADIVCFHGNPRPWDVRAKWIPRL